MSDPQDGSQSMQPQRDKTVAKPTEYALAIALGPSYLQAYSTV